MKTVRVVYVSCETNITNPNDVASVRTLRIH